VRGDPQGQMAKGQECWLRVASQGPSGLQKSHGVAAAGWAGGWEAARPRVGPGTVEGRNSLPCPAMGFLEPCMDLEMGHASNSMQRLLGIWVEAEVSGWNFSRALQLFCVPTGGCEAEASSGCQEGSVTGCGPWGSSVEHQEVTFE
jgi:hypothetical protein